MSSQIAPRTMLSRRRFLAFGAGAGSALLLAACAQPAQPAAAPALATATPVPPTAAPEPAPVQAPAVGEDEVRVMASDVIEHMLEPDGWEGAFGQVKFRIHEALHNEESVYYIRTDASDQAMAEEIGVTWVPLLNTAVGMENVNTFYMFGADASEARPAVIRWRPGDENYSSLFHCVTVTVSDAALELGSAEAVEAAIQEGTASIDEEAAPVFVNLPLVLWPEGGLTVDSELKEYLGGGQLFEPVDTANMTVTMKLHQCFPGSRYIVTDTSAAPMAPMMSVASASPTQQLKALGGTDEIWVFGNGIAGSGVMGFQPAIFDNRAGEPAWSPFWDHFTVTWADESAARLLRSSAEIRELVESGELEEWAGTPDTHPNGFVVNCPVPVLAPTTFEA